MRIYLYFGLGVAPVVNVSDHGPHEFIDLKLGGFIQSRILGCTAIASVDLAAALGAAAGAFVRMGPEYPSGIERTAINDFRATHCAVCIPLSADDTRYVVSVQPNSCSEKCPAWRGCFNLVTGE